LSSGLADDRERGEGYRQRAERHDAALRGRVERLEKENRTLTAQLQDALVEIDGLRAALEKGDD
jgi:hypothetical protein